MPAVSGVIPNLIGGLSQQPPAARLENTVGVLRNAVPSVVSGLRKRPPFRYGATLGTVPDGGFTGFIHERSSNEIKTIMVEKNSGAYSVKVYAEDGSSETVTMAPGSDAYLSSLDLEEDIGFMPVGDSVFIFNKTKVVAKTNPTETRDNPDNQITFVVTNAGTNADYSLSIENEDGTTVQTGTHKTHNTDPSRFGDILDKLLISFNTSGTTNDGNSLPSILNSYIMGNVMIVPDAEDWKIKLYESSGLVSVYKRIVNKFTKLPIYEVDGRLVQIAGDPEETADSYWVYFDEDAQLWKETVGYDAQESLDATTMPHILKDNGNGTWSFGPHVWGSREVGDDETNATPSFVGYTIKDLFLISNRMAILSDENMIVSEVGNFENFYRTTCTTLLSSDRLDVAALSSTDRINRLYHGIEFDDRMLIFSDRAQFRLDNSNGLDKDTMNLRLSTAFNASTLCKPVRSGSNILFVDDADNSAWADIREYSVDAVVGVNSSEIITKQVPELIATGVVKMITNNTLGTTFVITRGDRSKLFMHSAYWSEARRLQSAWAEWDSDNCEFHTGTFVGNRFWTLVNRNGTMMLLWVNLQETVEGDFDGIEILLDKRVEQASVSYDGSDSTVTLPYPTIDGETYTVVLTEDGVDKAGTLYNTEYTTGQNTLVVPDVDLTSTAFMVGTTYRFHFELSPIFIRDDNKVPVQDGRLQVRYVSFLFHLSSIFDVFVKHPGRPEFTSRYTGRILGRLSNTFGDVVVDDGEFRVPVSGDSQEVQIYVINDSPFNCRFSSVEWEGVWRPRTKRL